VNARRLDDIDGTGPVGRGHGMKGDHLYVSRGLYTHHGIDCGDGTVIHYREGESITRSSAAFFALGQTIQVKAYDVADPPDTVVRRAESRLGERDYHLVFNNCEHFVSWCKTGKHRSEQVEAVAVASIAGGLLGGAVLGSVFAAPAIAAAGIYGVSRLLEQAQTTTDPALAQDYLRSAIAQLDTTLQERRTALGKAEAEASTWDQAARLAVQQGRDDLARAALAKKYPYKLEIRTLEAQVAEVEGLRRQIRGRSISNP
jgi:hypothetical protein